jgi:thiamine-monophosphate kinase
MPEFELIAQHFTRSTRHTNLGIGDDAALISIAEGMELAISADMLVSGTHFFADADPYQLGWKSLAVNISDMAAMGAQPKWATLAIALPNENTQWLSAFSKGFFACAENFGVDLIGGDTTRASNKTGLTISIQIMGEIPKGRAIKRSGAKAGDDVWLSGPLGKAAAGLRHLLGEIEIPPDQLQVHLDALHRPQPRVALGLALRGIATSCLDISDGLMGDLQHILKASQVGATLSLNAIPTSKFIAEHLHEAAFRNYLLAGGDDYELCFTAPQNRSPDIEDLANSLHLPLTKIGRITTEQTLLVMDAHQQSVTLDQLGYNHFSATT